MKTLIVGAGTEGVLYGWALAEAGYDVTHFIKQGKKAQFDNGVLLDVIDDRKSHKQENKTKYPMKCVEMIAPTDHYELIILPIHFYQVEAALETLAPVSGEALFLDLGTNWNGTETFEKFLPKERYLFGFPYGGGIKQDGEYVVYLSPKIYLGEADGSASEKLARVKSFFLKADIQSTVPENILYLLWTSHAGYVGVSASLVKSGGLMPFLQSRAAMTECHQIIREIYELCRLRGVDPYKYPDQAMLFKFPAWLYITIFRLFVRNSRGIQRLLAYATNPAGDAEKLYPAMLKTAQELKFDMPRVKAAASYLLK
jgi:2-dehydropantoate 2-reductase